MIIELKKWKNLLSQPYIIPRGKTTVEYKCENVGFNEYINIIVKIEDKDGNIWLLEEQEDDFPIYMHEHYE